MFMDRERGDCRTPLGVPFQMGFTYSDCLRTTIRAATRNLGESKHGTPKGVRLHEDSLAINISLLRSEEMTI